MFRAHRVNVKKRYDIRFVIVNMFNAPVITGRVHTYPDIFENGFFFPPFSKKKISVHTLRVRIVFARPRENAKTVEIPMASHRTCVMLVVYDL